MRQKLTSIEKIDAIIKEYLESDEICPDKFIYMHYANINQTFKAFEKYAAISDDNNKKYKLFLKTNEQRKEKFLAVVAIIVNMMQENPITALDIELISKLSLSNFKTAITKPFVREKFGKPLCNRLFEICINSNNREVSIYEAMDINFTYKGRKLQEEDIIECISYLKEKSVSISIPNITFAFQKLVNRKIDNLNNMNKK